VCDPHGGAVACVLFCRVAPDHLGGFSAAGLHDGGELFAVANGDLEERLSSLKLDRVWQSSLPPGCLILLSARRCLLALRRSTSLAWPTLIGC
jgi:hypothetical protein